MERSFGCCDKRVGVSFVSFLRSRLSTKALEITAMSSVSSLIEFDFRQFLFEFEFNVVYHFLNVQYFCHKSLQKLDANKTQYFVVRSSVSKLVQFLSLVRLLRFRKSKVLHKCKPANKTKKSTVEL